MDTIDIIKQDWLKRQEDLADQMQAMLTEEVRPFPNTTIRKEGVGKTGIIAKSPRDVVDTGDTTDSYDTETIDRALLLTFIASWQSEGVVPVYFGYNQPPYPFIKMVLRRNN